MTDYSNQVIKPIFLISLPRSGSTLLQRILMSNSKVSSFGEPHFLLPFVYSYKKEGVISEYNHYTSSKGIRDYINFLPNKETDYYEAIKKFSLDMYNKMGNKGDEYFLDKSPSYVWIINDLNRIFPDAKFIFLFRKPMSIYASMLSTFSKNKHGRKFCGSYNILEKGIKIMAKSYSQMNEKSIAVNYEDLILHPEREIRKVSEYLNLDFNHASITNFNKNKKRGNMGDPTGVNKYSSINDQSLNSWKNEFSSFFRKRIIFQFVSKFDEGIYKSQGYNKDDLLQEISSVKTGFKFDLADFIRYQFVKLTVNYNINLFFSKSLRWRFKKYLS